MFKIPYYCTFNAMTLRFFKSHHNQGRARMKPSTLQLHPSLPHAWEGTSIAGTTRHLRWFTWVWGKTRKQSSWDSNKTPKYGIRPPQASIQPLSKDSKDSTVSVTFLNSYSGTSDFSLFPKSICSEINTQNFWTVTLTSSWRYNKH